MLSWQKRAKIDNNEVKIIFRASTVFSSLGRFPPLFFFLRFLILFFVVYHILILPLQNDQNCMTHRKMRFFFCACSSQDRNNPVFNSTKCMPDLAKVVKKEPESRCAFLKASEELSGIFLIPFLQIAGCVLYKLTLFFFLILENFKCFCFQNYKKKKMSRRVINFVHVK